LAHGAPATRDAFFADYRTSRIASTTAVVPKRSKDKDCHWRQWVTFCNTLGLPPDLSPVEDKLPFLQVFAVRLRSGELAPRKKPLRAKRVADFLCTVGETLADMGTPDPRLDIHGKRFKILSNIFRAHAKDDPPPERVKPIPMQLVEHTVRALRNDTTMPAQLRHAIADCIIIGYFFLLRPGEHVCARGDDNNPFHLQDVSFVTPNGTFNAATATEAQLQAATAANLLFTTQKNGERGKTVTQGDTSSALLSPVKALIRRVRHLRSINATADTPIYTVVHNGRTDRVTPTRLTAALRSSCYAIGNSLGLRPRDISARALRAGGAMALLRADVDPLIIRMVGRWKSWAMIRYLHRTATATHDFAARMLTSGNFTITTHPTLPADAVNLIAPLHVDETDHQLLVNAI